MMTLGVVVLGVTDRDRAAAFWSAALGYVPYGRPFGGWAHVLAAPDGSGARIALQVSDSVPEDQPRLHLDLHVQDAAEQSAQVERLVALGAGRVEWDSYPEDPDFVVLADPEGNRFCVVDVTHGD